MEKTLQKFIATKNAIMNYFGCDKDIPLKLLLKNSYEIYGDDGFYFLKYWDQDNQPHEFAIAKKDGEAMIFKKKKFTLVVAIDCIKIAFVFKEM